MDFKQLILDSKGKNIRITFQKRTTGETRTMVCRFGPISKAKVVKPKPVEYYDEHNLILVWELNQGWKAIPLDGILEVKVSGKIYKEKVNGLA